MSLKKMLLFGMKSNLRTKIMLFFAAMVLLFSVINGIGTYHILSSLLTRELLNDSVLLAASFSKHLTEPFLSRNAGKLTDLLFEQKYSHNSLAYLGVFDSKGQCFASTSLGNSLNKILQNSNPLAPGEDHRTRVLKTPLGAVYDIAVPLAYGRGVLRIGFFREHIDRAIRWILLFLLLALLAAFACAMILAHFLSGALVKPLQYFKRSVQSIGQGDLSTKVAIRSQDELGDLARAFDQMREDLSKTTVSRDSLIREMTVRKKTEENLARLSQRNELILNSAAEGILGLDREGNHTFVNPIAAKMLGYEPSELLGRFGHSLWHHTKSDGASYPLGECPIHGAFLKGEARRVSNEVFWKKDGSSFPVEYTSTPIYDERGQPSGAVVVFSDSTARKLYADMQNAKTAAELANKAKSQFLAAMSHEIRTPLSAVIGFTDILSKTPLTDEQKKYLGTMSASGKLLLDLVNDILDFSKIEAGKITLEEVDFDLEYLVKDVFGIIASKIEGAKIDAYIDFDENVPSLVRGDPTRMRQILLNLLNNAAKFTDQGEIGLVVKLSEEAGLPDEIPIFMTVRDTGIGIPQEKLRLLFRTFSQVDMSTTRKYGGTGLGLSICKLLVEKMGGRIWAESKDQAGSAFKFTVKLRKSAAPDRKKSLSRIKEIAEGKSVLLVDENRTTREILERYCREIGFSVVTAAVSPLEALDRARKFAENGACPSVVLSELRMAEMDGYQLAEKLKTLFPASVMKLIAVASHASPGAAREVRQRGFHGWIEKPVFKSDLIAAVGSIFGEKMPEKKIAASPAEMEFACKGLRVLVAEDAQTNRELIEIFLTQWGCQVDFAENGAEALEKLRKNRYDLCFMDLQMPHMGGLEAVQIIRGEIPKDFPIIALTAAATDETRIACLNNGMTDYIVKPISVDDLKKKLIKHVRPKN